MKTSPSFLNETIKKYIDLQIFPHDNDILRGLLDDFRKNEQDDCAIGLFEKFDDLSQFDADALLEFHSKIPKQYLNIGGGPRFLYPHWMNLEAATGPLNPNPFQLSQDCHFPAASKSFELVYSSHAFEHLDEPTVDRVLEESRRIIKPGGSILIKFPDYDFLFDAYRRKKEDYFSDKYWGLSVVTATLHNRGLVDSIHTRAAYIVCGFWNAQFGDLYTAPNPGAPDAYNGPPALSDQELERILSQTSPLSAARELRRWVVENEPDYTFNHQTAWSKKEFIELLQNHGFEVVSTDADKIIRRFSFVPKINEMHEISAYFYALPK